LVALLLIYIMVLDFKKIMKREVYDRSRFSDVSIRSLSIIMLLTFTRVIAIEIWIITCIRLQLVYLSTDAENIVHWLVNDLLLVLGLSERPHSFLDQTSLTFFTINLLLFISVTVLFFSFSELRKITFKSKLEPTERDNMIWKREFNKVVLKSFAIMSLLSMNLLSIGKFDGFSLVLIVSSVFSVILYYHIDPWKYWNKNAKSTFI